MNEHAIEQEEGKQPFFGLIYSLRPVQLKTLMIYIKTNLVSGFIWPFKSLARAHILFDRKLDGCFCLCVNHWGLNNLTINNRYLLSLINELLD